MIEYIKGLYGFRLNGKDYLSINQIESQPNGLGEHIFSFLTFLLEGTEVRTKLEKIKNNVSNIKFVKMHIPIKPEEHDILVEFHNNFGLSSSDNLHASDWATFFSLEEGNVDMYYDGFPYMIDWSYMMKLSKEIKYAYIINFDDEVFEVYRGNNDLKIENEHNRYSHLQHDFLSEGFYGVVLIKKIPFIDIKDTNKKLIELI